MIMSPVAANRLFPGTNLLWVVSTPVADKRLVAAVARRQRRHPDIRAWVSWMRRITVATSQGGGSGSCARACSNSRSRGPRSPEEFIRSSWLQAQQQAQPLPRVEQSGFHGLFRHANRFADLRVRQVREMPEHDDESLFLRELDQR